MKSLITWLVKIAKVTTKAIIMIIIKVAITIKIKAKVGNFILRIISTKIKEVHLIGLPTKGQLSIRRLASWKTP